LKAGEWSPKKSWLFPGFQQEDERTKKAHLTYGPFVYWLPVLDEFRNFLMSEEAEYCIRAYQGFLA
jgi:hypothetical protein